MNITEELKEKRRPVKGERGFQLTFSADGGSLQRLLFAQWSLFCVKHYVKYVCHFEAEWRGVWGEGGRVEEVR